MSDLLTLAEAAKSLRSTSRVVEDSCRRGELRSLFLGNGRRRCIHPDDLTAYVEARQPAVTPEEAQARVKARFAKLEANAADQIATLERIAAGLDRVAAGLDGITAGVFQNSATPTALSRRWSGCDDPRHEADEGTSSTY